MKAKYCGLPPMNVSLLLKKALAKKMSGLYSRMICLVPTWNQSVPRRDVSGESFMSRINWLQLREEVNCIKLHPRNHICRSWRHPISSEEIRRTLES